MIGFGGKRRERRGRESDRVDERLWLEEMCRPILTRIVLRVIRVIRVIQVIHSGFGGKKNGIFTLGPVDRDTGLDRVIRVIMVIRRMRELLDIRLIRAIRVIIVTYLHS